MRLAVGTNEDSICHGNLTSDISTGLSGLVGNSQTDEASGVAAGGSIFNWARGKIKFKVYTVLFLSKS